LKIPPQVRLLRLALVPTAIADVVTGAAYASTSMPLLRTIGACLAGACFYMGGMVLNDLADRDRDVYLAPDRPLVRHPRLASQAWGMVLALFVVGLLFASVSRVPLYGAIVAALAVLYDLGAKKKFPADAITLGGARAANLAMGIGVAGGALDWGAWTLVFGYGLYIAGVTAASRTEDFKESRRRRRWLAISVVPMLVGCGALSSLSQPGGGITLFLIPAVALVVALLHALKDGSPAASKRFVLRCLLCIFLLHGVLLWTTGHAIAVGVITALAAASIYLLRVMRTDGAEAAAATNSSKLEA